MSKPRESAEKNIFQRMHAVMKDVDYVQKEKKAGMRYSIVSHDAVTAKVRPVLVEHGVVYFPRLMELSQNGNRTQCQMTVRFQNIDDPADYMDVVTAGYGIDDQDKGPGKAISYCVKYALLKALGLESGDEPDEDQDTPHESALALKLKELVAGARDLAELTHAVLPKIQEKLFDLTKTEQALVRSHYAQRQRALQRELEAEVKSDLAHGSKGGRRSTVQRTVDKANETETEGDAP